MCVLCTPFIDKEVHVWQQAPLRRLLHMWALYTCNDQVGASISRAGSHMQGLNLSDHLPAGYGCRQGSISLQGYPAKPRAQLTRILMALPPAQSVCWASCCTAHSTVPRHSLLRGDVSQSGR